MIEVFFSGEREVFARFQTLGVDLRRELKVGISSLTVTLQNRVKDDKLSGQVLGVRSGRGRRSIAQVVTDQGETIVGIVSTAVPYMIGWETGWPDSMSVKSNKGRFNPKQGTSTTFANGSAKKRAFLVPSLSEMQSNGQIQSELDASVARAMQ